VGAGLCTNTRVAPGASHIIFMPAAPSFGSRPPTTPTPPPPTPPPPPSLPPPARPGSSHTALRPTLVPTRERGAVRARLDHLEAAARSAYADTTERPATLRATTLRPPARAGAPRVL